VAFSLLKLGGEVDILGPRTYLCGREVR